MRIHWIRPAKLIDGRTVRTARERRPKVHVPSTLLAVQEGEVRPLGSWSTFWVFTGYEPNNRSGSCGPGFDSQRIRRLSRSSESARARGSVRIHWIRPAKLNETDALCALHASVDPRSKYQAHCSLSKREKSVPWAVGPPFGFSQVMSPSAFSVLEDLIRFPYRILRSLGTQDCSR